MVLSSIDIIQVPISIGTINFHMINILILFFLNLKDMNRFDIYLNNIINQFNCHNSKNIPITCK